MLTTCMLLTDTYLSTPVIIHLELTLKHIYHQKARKKLNSVVCTHSHSEVLDNMCDISVIMLYANDQILKDLNVIVSGVQLKI